MTSSFLISHWNFCALFFVDALPISGLKPYPQIGKVQSRISPNENTEKLRGNPSPIDNSTTKPTTRYDCSQGNIWNYRSLINQSSNSYSRWLPQRSTSRSSRSVCLIPLAIDLDFHCKCLEEEKAKLGLRNICDTFGLSGVNRSMLQARSASIDIRATLTNVSPLAGESPRVLTTVSEDGSRDRWLCHRYVRAYMGSQ